MKRYMKIMAALTGIGCGVASIVRDIEAATCFGVMCLLFLRFYDDTNES